jgi:hypothetical protein
MSQPAADKRDVRDMSGSRPLATEQQTSREVSNVPTGDILTSDAAKRGGLLVSSNLDR